MSTIRVDNFGPAGGGTTYSARGIAKAWVNFNGTGTIAARDSENVSSLTDNGTGDYTVNISNSFGAADYAAIGSCLAGGGSGNNGQDVSSNGTPGNALAASIRFAVQYTSNQSKNDVDGVSLSFFGDLA
jgi:hypothetical protein